MKKSKILPIVLALAVTVSIGISVFALAYAAAADDTKKVQLVTLDYIENSLMQQIDDKIKVGSVESMKETVDAINATLDYLNTQVANNAGSVQAVSTELTSVKALITSLEERVSALADQSALTALQQQLEALQQRVATLEGTCSVLTQDVSALKESLSGIAGRVSGLESSISSLKTYCESSLTQLSGKISTNEQSITTLTDTATELKGAADTIRSELALLTASYDAMLTRVTSLESQAGNDRTDLMQMKLTLSSLQGKIDDMSGDYGEIIDAYNEYTKTIAALRAASDGGNASFSAIFLKEGEMLTCSGLPSDTMEIIVRRGNVKVNSPIPTQGILDMTDSVEILNGKKVLEYHYLILVGGGDGRGIVSQSGDAWILVRGEYEIG
ncbi:MAG: hypothetical protein E7599_07150 [Ruminococcaceae bacterium]|nr:hypothetical protein [Oscillospiraceae bacterium]